MNAALLLSTALSSIGANKLRAGLTLLGIVIGVSSVLAMMAVGRGAQVSVTSRISDLGTDLITVRPGAQALRFAFFGGGGNSDVLSLADALALQDDIFAPGVRLVAPENSFSGAAAFGSQNTFVSGVGVTAEYLEARNLKIASGRNISNADVQNTSNVVVLGSETSETLFAQRNPIGATIKISITTQQDTIETLEGTQGTFVILLGSIAGISLLVGGIGVMNIMLVSVTERTREIGIRRAVGAKRRDILFQFVAEAVLMTFGGGILGVLIGWTVAYFGDGASVDGDIIETVIETHIAFIALVVSVAVGLFFGIYPAVRAASLNPIEALRHE
jgi:ABC-type antimicrobial peptide transport system permease subunit